MSVQLDLLRRIRHLRESCNGCPEDIQNLKLLRKFFAMKGAEPPAVAILLRVRLDFHGIKPTASQAVELKRLTEKLEAFNMELSSWQNMNVDFAKIADDAVRNLNRIDMEVSTGNFDITVCENSVDLIEQELFMYTNRLIELVRIYGKYFEVEKDADNFDSK